MVLEESQHQRIVVGLVQSGEGFLQKWTQAAPVRRGFGRWVKSFHGLPFARVPAEIVAPEIEGEIARATAQPAGRRSVRIQFSGQGPCAARKAGKDILGNVTREIGR